MKKLLLALLLFISIQSFSQKIPNRYQLLKNNIKDLKQCNFIIDSLKQRISDLEMRLAWNNSEKTPQLKDVLSPETFLESNQIINFKETIEELIKHYTCGDIEIYLYNDSWEVRFPDKLDDIQYKLSETKNKI